MNSKYKKKHKENYLKSQQNQIAQNDKEKIIKLARDKRHNIQRNKIMMTADLFLGAMQVRSLHQSRLLYPSKRSFKKKCEIKTFSDIKKLKEFISSRFAL